MEDGEAILYVQILKALYGCLRSALLFYNRLVKDLESMGFELNIYDHFVTKKTINIKQFNAVWMLIV